MSNIAISPTINKTNHLDWLDSVRGAAALYVVCHHAVRSVIVKGDHAHDSLYRFLQLLTNYGHYAVDVFIVLSGYCLTLPLIRNKEFGDILIFYIRRTIRIVLPYYAAIIVTLFLTKFWLSSTHGVWAENALPLTQESIWKHLLLIHQWDSSVALKLNGAFWSVGVEYEIYFLFPLLYFLGERIGFFRTLVFITLTSYLLWGVMNYFDILNPGANGSSIYYCSLFYMEVVAAKYANQQDKPSGLISIVDTNSNMVYLLMIFGIVGLATISFILGYTKSQFYLPLQIQSFFIGSFVSILFYLRDKNNKQFFKPDWRFISKPLAWVGTIGFSVYLLHDPILAMVWVYIVAPLHVHSYFIQAMLELIIGLAFSLAISIVFYRLIEYPCHQLSKSVAKAKNFVAVET